MSQRKAHHNLAPVGQTVFSTKAEMINGTDAGVAEQFTKLQSDLQTRDYLRC